MEDLTTKVVGNVLTAAEFIQPMGEIQTVIQKSGIVLSSADSEQMAKALSTLVPSASFMSCTGVMPTKVLTSINGHQTVDGYVDGMTFRFRSGDSNGATEPTINVDSQGAKAIRRMDNSALSSGDIISTADSEIRYDLGTDTFLLINPQTRAPYPPGYVSGFSSRTYPIDPLTRVELYAGRCVSSDGTTNLDILTNTTKYINAPWASGNNQGGYANADILEHRAWYRIFVIGGPNIESNWGIDEDVACVNLLAAAGSNYTKYRQVGWVRTDFSNTNIIPFSSSPHNRNYVQWAVAIRNVQQTSWVADTPQDAQVQEACPPGCVAAVSVSPWLPSTAINQTYKFSFAPTLLTMDTSETGWHVLAHRSNSLPAHSTVLNLVVDLVGEFQWFCDRTANTGDTLYMTVVGYYYDPSSEL